MILPYKLDRTMLPIIVKHKNELLNKLTDNKIEHKPLSEEQIKKLEDGCGFEFDTVLKDFLKTIGYISNNAEGHVVHDMEVPSNDETITSAIEQQNSLYKSGTHVPHGAFKLTSIGDDTIVYVQWIGVMNIQHDMNQLHPLITRSLYEYYLAEVFFKS